MASYLSIYRGSEGGTAKLALSQVSASNHPSIERALRLLDAAWTEVGICSRPLKCRDASYTLQYLSKDETNLSRMLKTRQLGTSMPQLAGRQVLQWTMGTTSLTECVSPVMCSDTGIVLRSRSCRSSGCWRMSPRGELFLQSSRTKRCVSGCMGGGSARRAA